MEKAASRMKGALPGKRLLYRQKVKFENFHFKVKNLAENFQ
jgi:hypothetical protein